MKDILYLTFFIALIAYNNIIEAQGTWSQKHYIGYAYSGEPCIVDKSVAFTIGTKGYCCTGRTLEFGVSSELWEFDGISKTWSQKASLPALPRKNAVGFSINSKGYLGTGEDSVGTVFTDFWEYDPVTNTWNRKADFAGGARSCAVGFSLGSKGYIGTGANYDTLSTLFNDFWEYNPITDTWSRKADFTGGQRYDAIGMSIGSKGYLGTGRNFYNQANDFWEYDPIMNGWTLRTHFSSGRFGAEACSINGIGYIAGGDYVGGSYDDLWAYDTTSMTFSYERTVIGGGMYGRAAFSIDTVGYFLMAGNFSVINEYHPSTNVWDFSGRTRYYGFGFNIGNKGYVGGGSQENFGPLNDLWEYDVTTDTWSQKASCSAIGDFGISSFTIGNSAYVSIGAIKQIWEYKSDSNIWIRKSDFPGTGNEACAFSIDSIGYIGTGIDSDYSSTKDFWAYNAVSDTWIRKADFAGTTRMAAVGFSINHKGYICTGDTGVRNGSYSNIFPSSNDVWKYDPSTDNWTRVADFEGHVRSGAIGFTIGNNGYLGTGEYYDSTYSTQELNDFWEYNSITNHWRRISDCPGQGRSFGIGFHIGNKGYIGTGRLAQGCYWEYNLNDFWEYTPAYSLYQPICLVSIDTSLNKPVIVWEKTNKFATDSFYIFRSSHSDTNYVLIGVVGRDSLSIWYDLTAYPDSMSYRYKIVVLDTSGASSIMSQYHQTIFLIYLGQGSFSWIPYKIENDTNTLISYNLYRDSVGNGNWQLITGSTTANIAYDPDFASFPQARYKIAANIGYACTPTRGFTSVFSNVLFDLNELNTDLLKSIETSIRIKPNPAHNEIAISGISSVIETQIIISNTLGQIIYKENAPVDKIQINTQGWAPGTYTVSVSTANGSRYNKVVKW